MFLSIVIPIFNDENFINECLDSCLNQTLSNDEYEIICVDDGSTDRTPDILKEYATKHPNIRLMMMERHKGGRTVGYLETKGDYIWFVDHDDLIAPNAVSTLKQFAAQNPDADRIFFSYYLFQNELTAKEWKLFHEGKLWANDGDSLRYAVVWSGMFKHSFLLEHSILPRSKRIQEAGDYWGIPSFSVWSVDTLFNEEIFEYGCKTVSLGGAPLYYYRVHNRSEQNNSDPRAVEERQKKEYNRFLYRLYLVIRYKEAYTESKESSNCNAEDLLLPAIPKLIATVQELAVMPSDDWKRGMKLAKEKDVFFTRLPNAYKTGFSWVDFLRMQPKVERLRPKVALQYFLYSARAAKLYRFIMLPHRLIGGHRVFEKTKRLLKRCLFHR